MSQSIESLRQTSYNHCRSTSHSISEAAEKSHRYIQLQFNARSSTPASYLEQVYQDSLRSSAPTQPLYDGGLLDPFANIKAMLNELPGVADGRPNTHVPRACCATAERVPSHVRDSSSSRRAEFRHKAEERVPSYSRNGRVYETREPQYTSSSSSSQSSQRRTEERMSRGERECGRPCQDYTRTEFRDASGNYYEYTHTYYSSAVPPQPQPQSQPQPQPQPRRTYTERPRSPPLTSRRDRSPPPQPRRTYTTRPRTPHSYSTSSSSSPDEEEEEYHTRYRPRSPPPRQGTKPRTDLYTVLGISRTATATEIKKAHRAMSLKWHPDRCGEGMKDQATEMMAEINQANDVLGDGKKRAYYDRTGMMGSDL